jgi:hypothetical protein
MSASSVEIVSSSVWNSALLRQWEPWRGSAPIIRRRNTAAYAMARDRERSGSGDVIG